MSIAGVLAWSANPLGAYMGGLVIEWTGNVVLVFAAIGVISLLIAAGFSLTALGRAEDYLPGKVEHTQAQPGHAKASSELEEAAS
jgi:hypothetical protein